METSWQVHGARSERPAAFARDETRRGTHRSPGLCRVGGSSDCAVKADLPIGGCAGRRAKLPRWLHENMLQVNVFRENRHQQRIRPKSICHRLIPVADRFCCLGGPSGRFLPSRLHFLSGCRPVLIRDLSVLMLRFRVLGRRADETGPDRRRNEPSAACAAGAVPVRWAPARGAAESSGSVARPSLGNPDAKLNSDTTLVYARHSRSNCDTRR